MMDRDDNCRIEQISALMFTQYNLAVVTVTRRVGLQEAFIAVMPATSIAHKRAPQTVATVSETIEQ
jgi:hypothetical protein